MSENSKIEWCDHTFNPWIGCTKVSPACDHCYAERSTPARALGVEWGTHAVRYRTSAANWQKPLAWNNRPFFECRVCGWRGNRPAMDAGGPVCPNAQCLPIGVVPARPRVFCASLADVFDNAVDPAWRQDLFALIAQTPNLDWLLLTKRIGNARAMLNEVVDEMSCGLNTWDELPWPGVWIGATVVNQAEADRDIPKLLAVPARVRFLSIEPMLGPIDLLWPETLWPEGPARCCSGHECGCGGQAIDPWLIYGVNWVIAGGESSPGARPMHPNWARDLRDQCASAGVPFLFKQWGEWLPADTDGVSFAVSDDGSNRELEGRLRATQLGAQTLLRVGKHAAGRLLDGRTHNEFPQHTRGPEQ
ncbi:phage Gp37/Gp68 family protein [Burkholderia sp. 567]|uniref:phage Gp37/Gp68 family protein n=1 Tax=Burkholderia sp. 567 TaxID=3156413 RepID=UPI003391BECA